MCAHLRTLCTPFLISKPGQHIVQQQALVKSLQPNKLLHKYLPLRANNPGFEQLEHVKQLTWVKQHQGGKYCLYIIEKNFRNSITPYNENLRLQNPCFSSFFFIILSVPHSFYLTHFPMLRGKRSHWMLQMWSFTMHTETSYANCLPQGNLHADQWRKPNIRVFEVTTARRTFRAGNCWPCSMLGWWGMCGKDVTSAC